MDKIKDIFMLEDASISRKGLLRISLEEQKVEALGLAYHFQRYNL